MAQTVHDVAAEIRRRLPGVGDVKLHKLLYYAQGHHLAIFGETLFPDTISAWDMGPVVGTLWYEQRNDLAPETDAALDEADLNTLGYVISRYGGLTGADLKHLTHCEPPWRDADAARQPGTSVRINPEAMRTHFVAAAREEDEAGPPLDAEQLDKMLDGAVDRLRADVRADSVDELSRRLADLAG